MMAHIKNALSIFIYNTNISARFILGWTLLSDMYKSHVPQRFPLQAKPSVLHRTEPLMENAAASGTDAKSEANPKRAQKNIYDEPAL